MLTAHIRNFYKFLIGRLDTKVFVLKNTSRIKAFVFMFINFHETGQQFPQDTEKVLYRGGKKLLP